MAWTLLEEIIKSVTLFFFGYLLSSFTKNLKGVIMSEKCLIKRCSNLSSGVLKGLCLICYKKAKNLVDSGETTWESLADMGLCKHDPNTVFELAYKEAKKPANKSISDTE